MRRRFGIFMLLLAGVMTLLCCLAMRFFASTAFRIDRQAAIYHLALN